MNTNYETVLHLGYPKTASTWLQENLFIERNGYSQIVDRALIRDLIIKPHPLDYTVDKPHGAITDGIKAASQKGLVPILSNERLCGNPFSGGYDSVEMANRLKALFPEAKVLVFVREQRSALLSIYIQYVREGGLGGLRSFLNPPYGAKIPLFDPKYLEFDKLISLYRELYGIEKVLVVPYELMAVDPVLFLKKITQFCGREVLGVPFSKVYTALPYGSVLMRRFTNIFFGRDNVNPLGWMWSPKLNSAMERAGKLLFWPIRGKIEDKYKSEIGKFCDGLYVESNRALQQYVDCSLADFGYMLE